MSIIAWILTLSIVAGQLIRLPFGPGSMNLLDLFIIGFVIFHLLNFRFKLKKPPVFIKVAIFFVLIAMLSLIFSPLELTLPQILISFSYTLRFLFYIVFAWIISPNLHALKLAGVSLAILGLLQLIFFPDLSFLSILGWDPHYFRIVSTFLDPNFTGAFFVLTLVLFAGLILGYFLYSRFISLPKNIDRTASASFRINTWTEGWQLFEKHPFLGVGFNAYRYAIREYDLTDEQFSKSHGSGSNDSSLLSVLATTGLVGILSYFLFLNSIRRNLMPAVLGLLFHSFFSNSLFFPPILLWLILAAAADKAGSGS